MNRDTNATSREAKWILCPIMGRSFSTEKTNTSFKMYDLDHEFLQQASCTVVFKSGIFFACTALSRSHNFLWRLRVK